MIGDFLSIGREKILDHEMDRDLDSSSVMSEFWETNLRLGGGL